MAGERSGQQQSRIRHAGGDGRELPDCLRNPLGRRDLAKRHEEHGVRSNAVTFPNLLPCVGPAHRGRHTHIDDLDPRRRMLLAELLRQPLIVYGDHARRVHDDPPHRPDKRRRTESAVDGKVQDARVETGMVEVELLLVVVVARLFAQRRAARLVQLPVVQDHQARVPGQIAPQVIVMPAVTELIDNEVVGSPTVHPEEVVRVAHRYRLARPMKLARMAVHEDVDRVAGGEARQQLRVVLSDPRANGRQGRKPRQSGRRPGFHRGPAACYYGQCGC